MGRRAGAKGRRWQPIRVVAAVLAVLTATVDAHAVDEVEVPPDLPAIGAWTMTSPLTTGRTQSTATIIDGPACRSTTSPMPPWCGKVLVAGGWQGALITLSSAELYDPATGRWAPTGSMHVGRGGHTATLLADGKVLVVGGTIAREAGTPPALDSAELYDPATGTWTVTGSLADAGGPRLDHGAALLDGPRCRGGLLERPAWCGKVLVAGGVNRRPRLGSSGLTSPTLGMSTAALYDPSTGAWAATGSMALARVNHSTTVIDGGPCRTTALPIPPPYCGRVLVAGGAPLGGSVAAGYAEAEFYEPDRGVWLPTAPMTHQRYFHAAVLLDGPACRALIPAPHCNKVLVSGGYTPRQAVNTLTSQPTAELYDPLTGTWSPTGTMLSGWAGHSLTLVDGGPCSSASPHPHCGKVLATGPVEVFVSTTFSTPEVYDPATGTFAAARRQLAGLHDRAVLVDGGPCRVAAPQPPTNCGRILAFGGDRAAAELFDASTMAQPPTIMSMEPVAGPVYGGAIVNLAGAGFGGATEVRFGDQVADFRVESPQRIVAISPVREAGALDVTVTTPLGTSAATSLSEFSVVSASHRWRAVEPRLNDEAMPSATAMADGRVLLAGGMIPTSSFKATSVVELFDPTTGRFDPAAPLATARYHHTATRLPSGEVLVAGGVGPDLPCCPGIATAEVYDPATGVWRATGKLRAARRQHAATLLPSGKVLVTGGMAASAEIYDPDAVDPATGVRGVWSQVAPLGDLRYGHHAVLLGGRVLVFGGRSDPSTKANTTTAAIYDPVADRWTPAASPSVSRWAATATVLADGRVLLAGGCPSHDTCENAVQSVPAELYDPVADTWRTVPGLRFARSDHAATLLDGTACGDLCGRVMVTGGSTSTGASRSVEVFDPATESWGASVPMTAPRRSHRAILLADGRVLAVGSGDGRDSDPNARKAEVFRILDPGELPVISSVQPPAGPPGTRVRIFGSGFGGTSRVSFGGAEVVPELVTPTAVVAVAPAQRRGAVELELAGPAGTSVNDAASDADDFIYSPGRWRTGSALRDARYLHTSTLLDGPACRAPSPPSYCGSVVVAGGTTNYLVVQLGGTPTPPLRSSELYTPADATWRRTSTDMVVPRFGHTATLLDGPECHRPGLAPVHCGKVLVAGGQVNGVGIPDAELYDPLTGAWASTAPMTAGRFSHTATVLADGRVLVVAGSADEPSRGGLTSVEIYDPLTGSWRPAPPLAGARNSHSATRLPRGRVLVAGGLTSDAAGNNSLVETAELYDPAPGTWSAAQPMSISRFAHTATVLDGPDCGQLCGQVLVAGGVRETAEATIFHGSSELFDPVTGRWSPGGVLGVPRAGHTATMLANGSVLVVGGAMTFPVRPRPAALSTAEVFEPWRGRWSFTHQVSGPTGLHATSLLDGPACRGPAPPGHCGAVLISGGVSDGSIDSFGAVPVPLDAAGVYSTAPDVTGVAPGTGHAAGGAEVVIAGTGFGGVTTVRFGDTAAPSFRIDSPTRITAVAPPSAVVGPVEVVVDGPGGTSALVQPKAGTAFTYVGLPGAIAQVVATGLSETEVELRFSSAHNGDGSTVGQDYEVRQSTTPFTEADLEAQGLALCGGTCHFKTPALSYSLRVSDLTPGTTYHFALRAVNDQGPGPARLGVSVTTPGVAPVTTQACPPAPAPAAGTVIYPGGRYSLVGLPTGTVVGSDSPLYGWSDLGAGGAYSVLGATRAVTGGSGYWAWFRCTRAVVLPVVGPLTTTAPLGAYHASMVGNPSAASPATVSGHDFAARWDASANAGSGGYVLSGYRQAQSLAVGEGMWTFAYEATTLRIAADG